MLADARAALKNKWLYLSSAALLLRPTMELILSADMRAATDAMMFYFFVDAFTGIGRFIILFCILPYDDYRQPQPGRYRPAMRKGL